MWHLYLIASMLAAGVVIKLMLALAGKGRHRHGGAVTEADKRLGFALAVIVPVATLCLYLPLGRPDLPGSPAIFNNPGEMWGRQQALLRRHPLQVLLESNPGDLTALVQLADISNQLGAYPEAVAFYQRAVVAAQKSNDMLLRVYAVALGEAQVKAAKGKVGDDAIGSFEYARTLYADSPIARHYLALAKAQRGDPAAAIADWEALLGEGSPRPYWKDQVRKAMAETRAAMKAKKEK